jgi:hypothetical protein
VPVRTLNGYLRSARLAHIKKRRSTCAPTQLIVAVRGTANSNANQTAAAGKSKPAAAYGHYLLDEDAAPLGLLAAEDPPLMPPLDEVPPLDEDPPIPPPLDDEAPVPLGLGLLGLELLELEEPGELGAVLVEDDEEPPGTTTVSFSLVVELVLAEPLGAVLVPPGTTVVVSLRSQADNASRAPIKAKT